MPVIPDRLYHITDIARAESIKQNGLLVDRRKDSATIDINKQIFKHLASAKKRNNYLKKFDRNKVVFFRLDTPDPKYFKQNSTVVASLNFIELKSLDNSKIFVADNSILDGLLGELYSDNRKDVLKEFCERYLDSVLTYQQFVSEHRYLDYGDYEFMIGQNIPSSKLSIKSY